MDSKSIEQRENAIMDKIIKSSPDDYDKYYTEPDRDTNTFRIKKDPDKQEKYEIYQTIFTVDKKLARSINKEERKDFKKIRKQLKKNQTI